MDNPKAVEAHKKGKARMDLIPYEVLEGVARVLAHGAAKYGERNWLIDHIKGSTYEGSTFRHMYLQWARGEDIDPDSMEHHIDHAIAGLMVLRSAMLNGTWIDDRNRGESKSNESA